MNARHWSISKQKYLDLADLHDSHLLAAMAKFERGEYSLPADDDDPLVLRPQTNTEAQATAAAFDAECLRRGIGKYRPEPQP